MTSRIRSRMNHNGDVTAMDNAEPYDLVTVLMRLQGFEGMAHEIGRHSTDDLGVAAADSGRTGFFRMLVAKLRGRSDPVEL
jgi:hypothetical protein